MPLADDDLDGFGASLDEARQHIGPVLPRGLLPPRKPVILPTISFADVTPSCDADDFVEGLLTRGAMSVIYGESNSGKTFWTLDVGLHVAAGKRWRGRDVDQGFVLWLALEGQHGIRNRVAAWRAHHGLDDANLPFAAACTAVNLLDPNAEAGDVIATIRDLTKRAQMRPALIVVDTLARAIAGGNENSSEDMGALVRNGDMIRQETSAHLAWIHHSGKDQAKGARGHSSLRAATDTEIEIANADGARTMRVTKQRDMECGPEMPFVLRTVELGTNRRGKAVTSCVVEDGEGDTAGAVPSRRRLTGQKQRALEVLADLIATSGRSGDQGVPAGLPSVPDRFWRERFYDRAMPGADGEAKRKAFRRSADELLAARIVGMNAGRVWIVHHRPDGRNHDAQEGG